MMTVVRPPAMTRGDDWFGLVAGVGQVHLTVADGQIAEMTAAGVWLQHLTESGGQN